MRFSCSPKEECVSITSLALFPFSPPLPILKWLFSYNSETGELFRIRMANGNEINPPRLMNVISSSGYISVNIIDSNGLMKMLLVFTILMNLQFLI